MKRRTVLSGLVMFCGSSIIGCQIVKPKTFVTNKQEAQPVATPLVSVTLKLPVLRIWRDFSSSINERDLQTVIPEMLELIKSHSSILSGVEVVRFADEDMPIWSAPVKRFMWDAVPHTEIVETKPKKVPHGVQLARQMFSKAHDSNIANERLDRERQQEAMLKEHTARVEPKLDQLHDYLIVPPTKGAPCTNFAHVGRRIVEENSAYNVLIGDGWNDCGALPDAVTGMSGKLVIILTMRKGENVLNEEAFLRRKDEMHKLFPDAVIVPIYKSCAALEQMLKSN